MGVSLSLIILCLAAAVFSVFLSYFIFCFARGMLKNGASLGSYKDSHLSITEREASMRWYALRARFYAGVLAICSICFLIAALHFAIQLLSFNAASVMSN
jgi:hypothetical protein